MTGTPEPPPTREVALLGTFVELADTLVDSFDVVEFLQRLTERTVQLELADESGVLLADPAGELHVMAASQERTRLLELFQLQNEEGPCLEAAQTLRAVSATDLEQERERWPRFASEALSVGFRAVHAAPLRLRGSGLGALNLFQTHVGGLTEADRGVVGALSDIATIGLVQQRTVREAQTSAEQLQHALHSRIAIEQAKGMLAERAGLGIEAAFAALRAYARSHNERLTDIATSFIDGRVEADQVVAG